MDLDLRKKSNHLLVIFIKKSWTKLNSWSIHLANNSQLTIYICIYICKVCVCLDGRFCWHILSKVTDNDFMLCF